MVQRHLLNVVSGPRAAAVVVCALSLWFAPRPAAARATLAGDYPAPACTSSLPTTELRTARLVPPLYAGQTAVRVVNQSPAATIEVQRLGGPALLGPVATKNGWQFNLGAALVTGDEIRVCMTHTLPVAASTCDEWQEVQATPSSLEAPRFVYVTVDAGASAVAVGGIHPGAEVVLAVGGVVQSRVWAGQRNGVSLPLDPTLPVGTVLDVYQEIGAVVSATTSKTLASGQRPLNAPRLLGPIQDDDVGAWVSNVTPGSLVEIVDSASGLALGSKEMGETMGFISTCPISGSVFARATRNGASLAGATLALSVLSLGAIHSEGDFDFGTMNTATHSNVPRRGRWWAPLLPLPAPAAVPVVFMMHGAEPPGQCNLPGVGGRPLQPGLNFQGDSYLGYEFLADKLANMGIWVFSLAVEPDDLPVIERLELLDQVIDDVFNGGFTAVNSDSPLGLFGHSLGGDTVIAYATTAPAGYDVRGVLAVAPASWAIIEPAIGLDPPEGVALLHVMGSEDYFFDDPGTDFLRSIHHYDTAWRSKTQVMVRGAGHNCFNACWCLTTALPGSLSEAGHQEVLSLLAKPFFHGLLEGTPAEWVPYFRTHVRPKGLYQYDLTMQHHAPAGVYLLDNFGDAQNEVYVANVNASTSLNARGGTVTEVNAAPARQEETHLDLETSLGVPYQAEHLDDELVLLVEWNGYGWEYTSEIPANETLALEPTDLLSFRVMAVAGDNANDLAGEEGFEQDLIVIVSDGDHEARVRAGAAGPVPYPYPDADGDPVHVFATVRIPMDAFTASAPDLDLSDIRSVKLRSAMRDRGRLLIDDLELAEN